MLTPGEVALLLQQANQGDPMAADPLSRLVEDDLRATARKRRQAIHPGLNASTLLSVVEPFCQPFDFIRAENVPKRGGDWQQVSSDDEHTHGLDRFHKLAEIDSPLFRIRYFLSCIFEETAEIAGVDL